MEKYVQISQRQLEELTNGLESLLQSDDWEAARTRLARIEQAVWNFQVSPLLPLADQLESAVFATASQMGKKATLTASGFQAALEPSVRDMLWSALVHAIRNSLDHGIEDDVTRIAAQKPLTASLQATLWFEKGCLRVAFRDDGRGPDYAAIHARAVELGWSAPDDPASSAECLEFLFRSGFSTRAEPTQMSGRGVGMDAIRASIEQVGGQAWAEGVPGQGLTVHLELPVPLCGLETVAFQMGDAIFWLPTDRVRPVQRETSLQELDRSERLSQSLLNSPESALSLKGSAHYLLMPDQPGIEEPQLIYGKLLTAPAFRLFRVLDAIWASTGPSWMRRTLAHAGGSALAAKVTTRQVLSSQIGILADFALLRDLLTESTSLS